VDSFGATAFSSERGVAKPDPAIDRAACEALGMDPAACVYVDDGADQELAIAEALGDAGDPDHRTRRHRPVLARPHHPYPRPPAHLPALTSRASATLGCRRVHQRPARQLGADGVAVAAMDTYRVINDPVRRLRRAPAPAS
jgi:hypothetical protein